MIRHLVAAILLALAGPAQAGPAPAECADQFFGGQMPDLMQPASGDSQVLCFAEFGVQFSDARKTPLWWAEHLTTDRVRRAGALPRPRRDPFHEEKRLPPGVGPHLSDYARSGYDRGHMAPNGDMDTAQARYESFALANIIPQQPCNHEVTWEGIESSPAPARPLRRHRIGLPGPAF